MTSPTAAGKRKRDGLEAEERGEGEGERETQPLPRAERGSAGYEARCLLLSMRVSTIEKGGFREMYASGLACVCAFFLSPLFPFLPPP